MPDFYEFFAGGGMVRKGLGQGWSCRFANDVDEKKARTYRHNFSPSRLKVSDVRQVTLKDLPGVADLVWGSFPCQDLSLAGAGAGLEGERSGTFYPFWNLMRALIDAGRGPRIIALENVCGALTSRGGRDFHAICQTYASAGYRYGALVINASLFLPQSRPRLFLVGVRGDVEVKPTLVSQGPQPIFHPTSLLKALNTASKQERDRHLWWRLPTPPLRLRKFCDEVEEAPSSVSWHSEAQTLQILKMMTPIHRAKVEAAQKAGRRMVGGIYRRTRPDQAGQKVQRAEIRFDDVAGCLRTPAGGSSRQMIMIVDGQSVRSRLISARETARLMGLEDDYRLPENYNEAYHLTGDGVAVNVVRHLAEHIFEPLLGDKSDLRAVA